ncbi:MAG: hypothetical protein EHM78_19770 [Myxococcaceae bacterium]|nr:MAG: hypothetical protein EHM78_19770 [Myxococcaceae bacterium]
MRTRALVQFRLPRERLQNAMPRSLRWVAQAARDTSPGRSQVDLEIRPEQLDELLRWGRAPIDGATKVRIARLSHSWSREELGQGLVEIRPPVEREPPEVVNLETAFVARWSCACCDRIDLEQVAPLEVTDLDPDSDLQFTATREVLLAARLREIAERKGALTRPLAGSTETVQLLTPSSIQVAPVFPLVPVGERCPCCGRQGFDRSDHVEGSLSSDGDTGLVVAQEWPLTIEPTPTIAGQSVEPLGWRGRASSEPIHREGQEFDLPQVRRFRSGRRPGFIGLELWDALAAAGARLPPCMPVRVTSQA